MKIIPLKRICHMRIRNSYLILGDWNRVSNVNTIIDPGNDTYVLREIEKRTRSFDMFPLAQVILTHNAGQQLEIAKSLRRNFRARILAGVDCPEIDECLGDGQIITAGDDVLEVLHTRGSAPGSVCLYSSAEKTLLSGDMDLRVNGLITGPAKDYADALLKIACRAILKIYPAHDELITSDCQELLIQIMRSVCKGNLHGYGVTL